MWAWSLVSSDPRWHERACVLVGVGSTSPPTWFIMCCCFYGSREGQRHNTTQQCCSYRTLYPYLAGRMGGAVGSGLLITSTKKSNVSVCATAACTSSLCRFLRLFFSAKHHALQTVPHTHTSPTRRLVSCQLHAPCWPCCLCEWL